MAMMVAGDRKQSRVLAGTESDKGKIEAPSIERLIKEDLQPKRTLAARNAFNDGVSFSQLLGGGMRPPQPRAGDDRVCLTKGIRIMSVVETETFKQTANGFAIDFNLTVSGSLVSDNHSLFLQVGQHKMPESEGVSLDATVDGKAELDYKEKINTTLVLGPIEEKNGEGLNSSGPPHKRYNTRFWVSELGTDGDPFEVVVTFTQDLGSDAALGFLDSEHFASYFVPEQFGMGALNCTVKKIVKGIGPLDTGYGRLQSYSDVSKSINNASENCPIVWQKDAMGFTWKPDMSNGEAQAFMYRLAIATD